MRLPVRGETQWTGLRAAAFVAALALVPAVAHSAILEVTDCGDANPSQPGQLRRLISDAAFGDTIVIPACTITLTGAADDDANLTGDLDITKRVTLQGAGIGRTVLHGGGVDRVLDVRTFGETTIADLTITGGSVPDVGGGIRTIVNRPLLLRRVEVSGNTGGLLAGGIFAGGPLRLELTTVSGNSAVVGGGILASGRLIVENSTISGNTGHVGGGIYLSGTDASLLMIQSTVSGNRATEPAEGEGEGGGIRASSSGPKHILQSTIADNQAAAATGAGIFNDDPPAIVLRNSLLAGNTPANCGPGAALSAGHNLSSDASCALAGPGDLGDPDPGLGPLAANGGPTLTHALRAGSPAIDQAGETGCPSVDQRGIRRPQAGHVGGLARCDIGAVERRRPSGARVGGE